MISARSAVDQDRMVETGTLGRIAPPSTRLRAWSNSSLGHKEPSCLGRCCGWRRRTVRAGLKPPQLQKCHFGLLCN